MQQQLYRVPGEANAVGTMGFVCPEYLSTRAFGFKADVYSWGKGDCMHLFVSTQDAPPEDQCMLHAWGNARP